MERLSNDDYVNSFELAKRISGSLSDRYSDEEKRKEVETDLYNELSQLANDNILKTIFVELCNKISETERALAKIESEVENGEINIEKSH